MNEPKWIMLIAKLPTRPSPPKMSIHWSTHWPFKRMADRQKEKVKKNELGEGAGSVYVDFLTMFGREPVAKDARKIIYNDRELRVWPHEFTEITPENMRLYVEESHELVSGTVAEETLIKDMKGIKKEIYDAALLDGCTHYQAQLMALGVDVSDENFEFPPIGWYRIKREYGEYFCTDQELEETHWE